jgi:hypothetical protein
VANSPRPHLTQVGRPGLWYGVERFGTRSQFQSMSIKCLNGKGRVRTYSVINYDNEQCPGSKCYFQTLTGKRPYYCVILAIGSYIDCMLALKKYEDLTLHFPFVPEDFLLSREIIDGLNEKNTIGEIHVGLRLSVSI